MCGIWWFVTRNAADSESNNAPNPFIDLLKRRGPDSLGFEQVKLESIRINCHSSVLRLRGPLTNQPLQAASGSLLAWNGEIFAGLSIEQEQNDGIAVLEAFEKASTSNDFDSTLAAVICSLRGPWAFTYWDANNNRLIFGRDCLGRRSLLWRRFPNDHTLLAFASVAADTVVQQALQGSPDDEEDQPSSDLSSVTAMPDENSWREVPAAGVFVLHQRDINSWLSNNDTKQDLPIQLWPWVNNHNGTKLPSLQRPFTTINMETPTEDPPLPPPNEQALSSVREEILPILSTFESLLSESVRRRVQLLVRDVSSPSSSSSQLPDAVVAIMFSGGLDSMVLAALTHRHTPPNEPIDLLNVAFAKDEKMTNPTVAFDVPDRVTARAGFAELKMIAPSRKWRLIEVDVFAAEVQTVRDHVLQLIYPSATVLDLSIGTALWFASRGQGKLISDDFPNGVAYQCQSRVVLMGIGADEQLAGYGRHWTRFRQARWLGLASEINLDVTRISSRNLGRDDRIISDHAREVRAPFLDEDFVNFVSALPTWQKADLRLPRGIGDKLILRQMAWRLGLHQSAMFPKRAIQFGSRIAKIGTAKEKGSDPL